MNKKAIESNGKSIVFCIFFSMVLCICYACLNRYETQKDIAKVIENQNKIMAIQNVIIENQNKIMAIQNVIIENQNKIMATQNAIIENQNKIMAIQNVIIENQGQIISLQSSMTKSTLRVEQELYKVSALTFEFYGFPADKKTK